MVLRLLLCVTQCVRPLCLRMTRSKLLLAVLVSIMFLFSLHVSSHINSRRWSPPEWFREEEGGRSCRPQTNIGFLKNHKCASSAIQNILFRYGLGHKLHFALPEVGNYFGGGIRPFQAGMALSSPWFKLGVNIMAIHTKWDHSQVQQVMPNDTVYITIVREPSDLFESLYGYTHMQKLYNKTVEEYALSVPAGAKRYHKYIGYNQMVWDLGMPKEHMNNLTAVEELVRQADGQFDLVLVAERMDESLVLLSHLLCWDLEDVLVLRVNARGEKYKQSIRPETRKVLNEKLAPDYLLYDHFTKKFEELVEDFGKERMAREVAKLRTLLQELMKVCSFVKKNPAVMSEAEQPSSDMVEGYAAEGGSSSCVQYSRSELSFIKLLRGQHRQEVQKKFRLPVSLGLDALPLGSQLLNSPDKVAENIDKLKKMLVHREDKVAETSVVK